MIEAITGITLAAAAGLNAYIPLLGLGLLSRFTDVVALPENWQWLESNWSLGIVGFLLMCEIIVDKVPALDSVNDVIHTVIRPTSGGLVFAAGSASTTLAVDDPSQFFTSAQIWPFVVGLGIALIPHLLKSIARPILNALTVGAGTAAMSLLEDLGALLLTILAVIVPIIALALLVVVIALLARKLRRALQARRSRASN